MVLDNRSVLLPNVWLTSAIPEGKEGHMIIQVNKSFHFIFSLLSFHVVYAYKQKKTGVTFNFFSFIFQSVGA